MESRTRPSFGETRTGRFLTGVAIVWSIAGAFVALEIGLPELLSRAVSAGVVPDSLLMPGGLSRDSTTHCQPGSSPGAATPSADKTAVEARYLAWRLGFQVGWSAGLANMKQSDEGSARLLAEWQAKAGHLGIPAPVVPPIRHTANALGEFELHLESDPQCTAARFSQLYGQRHGSAFKLGGYVGFATVFRMALPTPRCRAEHSASRTIGGVPAELFQPLLQTTLGDVPGAGTQEKLVAILDSLTHTSSASNPHDQACFPLSLPWVERFPLSDSSRSHNCLGRSSVHWRL